MRSSSITVGLPSRDTWHPRTMTVQSPSVGRCPAWMPISTIATMSIITMVVSLTASLISGPISDKMHTHKVPVIIASLLFAIGTAMPWIMPSVTGMYLYAGIAGFGYGVCSAIDQALNVDVLPNKEEAGKGLGILNLATTLGQAVGPTITSVVKTTTGTYTPAFAISIVMAVCAAVFVLRIQKVK